MPSLKIRVGSKTLVELRDRYLGVLANSKMAASTLNNYRTYFRHLLRILGDLPIADFTHDHLQEYVDQRGCHCKTDNVGEMTIRKELSAFRVAWNWGGRNGLTTGVFPSKGLQFHKSEMALRFMTREEIEWRIAQGGASEDLWEALYLRSTDIEEVLVIAKESAQQPFVYPMFCMAAFTGARRRELLASHRADFDFAGGTVLIRDQDRTYGMTSTRQVPMAPRLALVIRQWFHHHPGGPMAFVKTSRTRKGTAKRPAERLTGNEADEHFRRALVGTDWECLRGWRVLRHSFIAACVSKGIDQRILDEWVGSTTKRQRRRFSHLLSVDGLAKRSTVAPLLEYVP
jgi:integrase